MPATVTIPIVIELEELPDPEHRLDGHASVAGVAHRLIAFRVGDRRVTPYEMSHDLELLGRELTRAAARRIENPPKPSFPVTVELGEPESDGDRPIVSARFGMSPPIRLDEIADARVRSAIIHAAVFNADPPIESLEAEVDTESSDGESVTANAPGDGGD